MVNFNILDCVVYYITILKAEASNWGTEKMVIIVVVTVVVIVVVVVVVVLIIVILVLVF